METEDPQQTPATAISRVVTAGVWLVVMLVGYVASIGPASGLRDINVLPRWLYDAVYSPLISVYYLNQKSWPSRGLVWWATWWIELFQR